MRFFQELFPREASMGMCIKCSQKFCNIPRKTLLAEHRIVNVLKLQLAFLFKKRRLSQIISEAAV